MPDPDPIREHSASAIALTAEQQFEMARMNLLLDQTNDVLTLRNLAKQFLHLWFQQKAATNWVMRQPWGS